MSEDKPWLWKKGQSQNPGGRPKDEFNVRALAAQYTEEAILKLVEIMRQPKDKKASIAATNSLLDRAHGKPTQMMASDESMGGLIVNVNMVPFEKPGVRPKDDVDKSSQ